MSEAKEPRHLSLAELIALHREVSLRTGSSPAPLRDETLLESAMMRPRTAAFHQGADLVRQAAVLGVSISQAQAFVDGSKRVALAAMDVFLILNGLRFTGDYLELARQIEAVTSRIGSLDNATTELEAWLRARIVPPFP